MNITAYPPNANEISTHESTYKLILDKQEQNQTEIMKQYSLTGAAYRCNKSIRATG